MTNIYLVSETYFKENMPVSYNVDWKLLKSHVISAQETHLQTIIGSEFYEHILLAFSGQTLNSDETILVQDYIKPQVLYRALEMALPFMYLQLNNKGPQVQREDYSNPSDFNQFKFLLNEIKNRAEFYEKRIVTYLCKNANLFPNFRNQPDAIIEPNNKNGFDSGLLFY
jgi:hypothetical protein